MLIFVIIALAAAGVLAVSKISETSAKDAAARDIAKQQNALAAERTRTQALADAAARAEAAKKTVEWVKTTGFSFEGLQNIKLDLGGAPATLDPKKPRLGGGDTRTVEERRLEAEEAAREAVLVSSIDPKTFIAGVVSALPDEPPGGGVRTRVYNILVEELEWKESLSAFPHSIDEIDALRKTLYDTYGNDISYAAVNALNELGWRIRAAVEAESAVDVEKKRYERAWTRWPGMLSVTDPVIAERLNPFIYGLHPQRLVQTDCTGGGFWAHGEGSCTTTTYDVLIPINTPADRYFPFTVEDVRAILASLDALYPDQFGPAKAELQRIIDLFPTIEANKWRSFKE